MRPSVSRAALPLLQLLLAVASAEPIPGIAPAAVGEVIAPAAAAADVAKEAVENVQKPANVHATGSGEGRYADADDSAEQGGLIADIVTHNGGLSRVRKSCPPFGPCKQFCIEVRPRDPRQSPFIICEPPDHVKHSLPPYPYNPLYPYYPDYEFPYPPAPKDPLLPVPVPGYPYPPKGAVPPVPSYPGYPYPYSPYYKAPYPLPYYPVPVPGQNSASSAAATATASTALHGLSGLVPHFREVDDSSSSSADDKTDASADSSEQPKASETATPAPSEGRSVFDPPYQTYVYPPEVTAPCYGDQKYPTVLPLPGMEKPSPVALLQLFLRPSHHHHHHPPPYPLPPPEYRESSEAAETMRQASDSATPDGDGKSGPMKVNLSLDHNKKTDSTGREANIMPMYAPPAGSPFVPYGYPAMPYGYPAMPYGPAGVYPSYYKSAEAKQSEPDSPAAAAPSPVKPAGPADAKSPKGDATSPAANTVLKGGISDPAIPNGPAPSSVASSPAGSSPPAAASTSTKDTPPSPSPSASKPRSAAEEGAQPKMAFAPLGLHGYPPPYGYYGQPMVPMVPTPLYNAPHHTHPGFHFGLNL